MALLLMNIPDERKINITNDNIYNNDSLTVPEPMSFDELHHWWQKQKTLAA